MESIIRSYTLDELFDLPIFAAHFEMERLENLMQKSDALKTAHRHQFYTILLVSGGTGQHTVDFESYTIDERTAFFVSPGQVYSLDKWEDLKGFVIFFTNDFFSLRYNNNILKDFPFFHSYQGASFIKSEPEAFNKYLTLTESMYEEFTSGQSYKDMVLRSHLNILLFTLYRSYKPQFEEQHTTANIGLVRKFEFLIEEHFSKVKSVKIYADKLFVSPNYLNAVCNRVTGRSAGQMIRDRVMIEAKRLLIHTKATVSEIAYRLDFKDNSYFTRFFRKYEGITPEDFRKRSRE